MLSHHPPPPASPFPPTTARRDTNNEGMRPEACHEALETVWARAGPDQRGPGRDVGNSASERSRRSPAPADLEGPSTSTHFFQLFRHQCCSSLSISLIADSGNIGFDNCRFNNAIAFATSRDGRSVLQTSKARSIRRRRWNRERHRCRLCCQ